MRWCPKIVAVYVGILDLFVWLEKLTFPSLLSLNLRWNKAVISNSCVIVSK